MASSFIDRVINDTYRIHRVIGTGGMGSVFEASHLRIPRRFAVKILTGRNTTNRQALQRFYREARITSELGHENIIEVVDFNSTEGGVPFIVMELLQGEDLAQRIYRCQRLALEQTSQILLQVGSAMEVVHDRGIVHRDLKPSNIFLCPRVGKDDLVKVLDFGISKIAGRKDGVTNTRTLMGSLYFIAPEQVRSSEVDYRADIYSMGSIVYAMLAGCPPFCATDGELLVAQILAEDPPALWNINPRIPSLVESVVRQALQKHPEERFDSMMEFAREFELAVLRSRSEDFDRTDLVDGDPLAEGEDLVGNEAAEAQPDEDDLGLGRRELAQIPTQPVVEDRREDAPTIEHPGAHTDVDLAAEDMQELSRTPGPRRPRRRRRLVTLQDPPTAMDWPPKEFDAQEEQPTNEWRSVSQALEFKRLQGSAENRETEEVLPATVLRRGEPDTERVAPLIVGAAGEHDTEEHCPQGGADAGASEIPAEPEDTCQVLLREAYARVPTDEVVPTRVVWPEKGQEIRNTEPGTRNRGQSNGQQGNGERETGNGEQGE